MELSLERKLLGANEQFLAQIRTNPRISKQRVHRMCQRWNGAWSDWLGPSSRKDLTDASNIGRDHAHAASHRLQQGHRQVLPQRRKHEHVECLD